ncbi:MAG: hypothetical protein KDA81_17395 [Planctomycetaceae bacterium]|nr:hypothetical protein [Planctomycetaceae bacterium]
MANDANGDANVVTRPQRVSTAREAVSKWVLVLVLIVLAVEVRAALGHRVSMNKLREVCPEGVFFDTTHAQFCSMLTLFPEESVTLDLPDEVEYRYGWFSLLRPVFNRPEAAVYVTIHRHSNYAMRYCEEPPTEGDLRAAARWAEFDPSLMDESGDDGSGMGFGPPSQGGGPGFGGPRGSRRPPVDPALLALDGDQDGELSEEEINSAAVALQAVDADGDGSVSAEEFRTVADAAAPGRRPELEDDSPAPESATPETAPETAPEASPEAEKANE